MKSLIYISEQFQRKFIVFFFFLTNTNMAKQTMPVFCVNETKFKPQATAQKSEVKVFNWGPYLQYLRFQIYGRHLTYPILFVYYFIIYTKMQICVFWKCMKLDISLTCKKSPCLLPIKTKETKKETKQKTLSFTRSSRPEVFWKKGVLRNFTKFTRKHLF